MFIETLEFTIPVDLCEIFSTMKRGPQANLEFPASVNSYGTTQDANVQVVLRANKLTFKVDGVSSDASMISKSECRTLKLSVFDVDRSLMPFDENDYQSNDISTVQQSTSALKRTHEQSISIPSAKNSRTSYSDSPRPRSPPHRRSQPRASPRPTENSQSKSRNHNQVDVKQEPEEPDLIEIEPDPEDVVPKTETPYMQIDYSATGPCTQTSQAALDRLSFPQPSQSHSSSSSSFQQNVPHVPDYAEPGPSQHQQSHRGDQSADDYLVFQGDEEGDDNEADYSNDEKDVTTTNDKDEDILVETITSSPAQMNGTLHSCDVCKKTYTTKMGLTVHLRTHSGVFPFKCSMCSQGFNTQIRLKEHFVKHLRKPFATCKICGKGVATSISLVRHLALHSSAKLSCSQCAKVFHTRPALKRHMIFHSEKTSFCKKCNKYYHKELLKKHEIETHGDTRFKCKICEFETTRSGDLSRHMKKHSFEKLEVCNMCWKSFKSLASLKRHRKNCKGKVETPYDSFEMAETDNC